MVALVGAMFIAMAPASAAGELAIKFSDSDGVVPDGTTLQIASVTDTSDDNADVTSVAWVRISGELDGDEGEDSGNHATGDVDIPFTIVIPAGTTHGEYTVSVGLGPDSALKTGSATFTVGDPGTNVSSASLSLARTIERANLEANDPDTEIDESAWAIAKRHATSSEIAHTSPETAVAGESQEIFLTVAVSNSLDKPSNWANGAITGFSISAPGGTITQKTHAANISTDPTADEESGTPSSNTLSITTITASSVNFVVTKSTPGMVDVTATVVGGDGLARSETITLTFTGPVDTIALGDASDTLLNQYVDHDEDGAGTTDKDTDPRDNVSFALTASDGSGNAVVPTNNAVVTIKGPDGGLVEGKLDVTQSLKGVTNTIGLQVDEGVTASSPLESGAYTIEARDGRFKAEATFVVVGKTDTLSVEASDTAPSELGQTVSVTATAVDADGEPVADGTMVSFTPAGRNAGVDVAVRTGTDGSVATRGGEATATFVIATNGPAIVTAVADGKSASAVLVSTAGASDDAMPEEEASVACLSNLAGFSTWSCGVETSASEIFGFVSARGATAIHLWNGSAWVRYSVVDGTMVPGSSDFMVAENDILYISN